MRGYVDMTVKFTDFILDARNFNITLNTAQARAVVEELSRFFGFNIDTRTSRSGSSRAPHGPQEYMGNGKHAMERVGGDLYRLRVPGGWLYGDTYRDNEEHRREFSGNTTFVPMPDTVGYKI